MPDPTPPDPYTAPIPLAQRDTIDLPAEPPPSKWEWVMDRNPLFLLSGVLMLAGCFLVSQTIHEADPAEVGDGVVLKMLIGLLVVLNVYEFAVIGLGLALAKTRTLVRDTRHLLGLAMLLLVDAGFVYTESGIFAPSVGVWIAAIATLLACVKAWLVLRALDIELSLPAMGVTCLSLAGMYGLPVIVRAAAHDGFLGEPQAYLTWAGVGLLVGLYAVPGRWVWFGPTHSEDHRALQRLVSIGLVGLPIVSLIGHAGAALWVYENNFEPSVLSPLLLGVAAIILRHHVALGGGRPTAQAATLVVACAVVASLFPSEALVYQSKQASWVAVSPLRGVLLIAPLLLGWAWWIGGRRPVGLGNAMIPLIAAALGHTPTVMIGHTRWLAEATRLLVIDYLPKTKLQWGTTAISAAFAFLIIGGLLSWWRRGREQTEAAAGELIVERS